jgi:hypothetical protein
VPSKVIETAQRGAFPDSSFKYTPFMHVRILYASFVQGLFHAAPRGAYHWEPVMENTELVVTDETPIHVDTVGVRPAITFTRGPVQFYSLGLDDMLGYDFETGQKKKSVLVPGTMSINCCSKSDLESEQIAWVIAEHLWLLREVLMRQGFFEIGRQPNIGSPSPAGSIVAGDGAKEWYCTTISSPYQFYRTSQFTPLSKQIVQNINMSIRGSLQPATAAPSPDPLDGRASTGAHLPLQLHFCPPPPFAPAASDVNGGTFNPGAEPTSVPTQPHPLNPAVRVVVRQVRPNRPGITPPVVGARPIPLTQPCVEESTAHVTDTNTVKV